MRILFDEGVPHDLAAHFPRNFQVSTAQGMGWNGKSNGDLLRLARQASFDVLVTMDKRMQHQQNPRTLPLPVVMLSSRSQDSNYLEQLVAWELIPLLEQGLDKRFYQLGDSLLDRR